LNNNKDLTGDYGSDLYSHITGTRSRQNKANRKEYEVARSQKLMNNQANLGYAMVTYSHADEVRQAILRHNGSIVIEGQEVKMSRM
jgi:hypothetical protein